MINYTRRSINFWSLILTIIVFISTQFLQYIVSKNNFNFSILNPFYKNSVQIELKDSTAEELQNEVKESKIKESIQNTTKDSETERKLQNKVNENINQLNKNTKDNKQTWKIKILKIALEVQIAEGTEEKILEDYVGHFSETSKTEGNIGLAAHNRGYKNNYFSRLKELKEGDEIQYQYNNFQKTYIVKKHEIIEDTNWTNLEQTKENVLTLITCVENEPNYRRCIQAIEKKG